MKRQVMFAGCAAVVGLALMLSGCATTPAIRPPLPPATPVAVVDCDSAVTPGSIPRGFVPVVAYQCDQILTMVTPGAEPPPPPPAPPYAYKGDLSALVAALSEPDDPQWDGACSLMMKNAADIWLEDAAGTVIRVGHPVDGCGQAKSETVWDAIKDLTPVQL